MYEVFALTIGERTKSGDAILVAFVDAVTQREHHVIIDGGYQADGDRVVETYIRLFGTTHVDAVILTHPDGDHIGGLGAVVRRLDVGVRAVHRPALHGGSSLRASAAVEDLVRTATDNGVSEVIEPFAGTSGFNGALYVAGPSESYYETCIQEQVAEESGVRGVAKSLAAMLSESRTLQRAAAAVLPHLPAEIPFSDAGGDNARNNSSAIVDISAGGQRVLFTADAGVPALNQAADELARSGRSAIALRHFQIPHHGSRHNLDSDTLDRLLGQEKTSAVGWSFVSISTEAFADPRYPSPRITNACLRRGYPAVVTAHNDNIELTGPGVQLRPGYTPITALPPLDETIDDR